MTPNEIKDALENSGHVVIAEKKLPHGIQLVLRGGTNINAYETGSHQVQGTNWQRVSSMLNKWDEYLRLTENTPLAGLERLERFNVSTVKRALTEAGFPVLKEVRCDKWGYTQLRLWGRSYVYMLDNGYYDVGGADPNRVRTFMKVIRWGRSSKRQLHAERAESIG